MCNEDEEAMLAGYDMYCYEVEHFVLLAGILWFAGRCIWFLIFGVLRDASVCIYLLYVQYKGVGMLIVYGDVLCTTLVYVDAVQCVVYVSSVNVGV